MKGSKITSLLLTCAMLLSLVVIPASAAEGDLLISPNPTTQEAAFPDVADHWGKGSVERWAGYGVLKGDETGAFNPDKQMTRAEFATMLVNLMGYTEKAENSFADVKDGDWYADAILKLAAAGIMKGDGVNANPNAPISREETAVLLCRAMNIQPSPNASVDFADKDQVASWAQDAVAALSERGMINGMGDNQFAPALEITRASVATMVDNMVAAYVVDGTQELTGEIKGVVIIAADSDVTIKDATLSENVIVAPKAANATVALTGKTVAQDVILSAASASVSVEKDAAAGAILVEAPKSTVSVAGKADSVMTGEAGSEATVSVAKGATVDAVSLSGKDAKLDVTGTVKEVQVSSTASNTEVVANSGAKIDKMETSADNVAVSGKGTIKDMTVTAGEGVEVSKDTKVDKIENKGDAPVDVGGKPVEPGKDTSNQGGSSSGGGNSGGNTPAPATYGVTITATGGTVTSDSKLTGYTADENVTITLKVTPNEGYVLTAFTVDTVDKLTDAQDGSIDVTVHGKNVAVVATFAKPVSNMVIDFVTDQASYERITGALKMSNGKTYLSEYPYQADFASGFPWLVVTFDQGVDGAVAVTMTKGGESLTFKNVPDGASGKGSTTMTLASKPATAGRWVMFELNKDLGITEKQSGTYAVNLALSGKTETASKLFEKNGETVQQCAVTFDVEGTPFQTQTVIQGEKLTAPVPAPTKKGYTFVEWCKESAEGTAWNFANETATGTTLTLYAKFTKDVYKITYDATALAGGTNPNSAATYSVDTPTITLNPATRPGYTFGGWYKDQALTSKVTSIPVGSTGDIVLYAQWTANTYKITYTLNGGTNNAANAATYTYGAGLTLQAPTKTGSEFYGWATADKDFANAVKDVTISVTDTGEKTFYALWVDPQEAAFRGKGPADDIEDADYQAAYTEAGVSALGGKAGAYTLSVDTAKLAGVIADPTGNAYQIMENAGNKDVLWVGFDYTVPTGATQWKISWTSIADATGKDLEKNMPDYMPIWNKATTVDEDMTAYIIWYDGDSKIVSMNHVTFDLTIENPLTDVTKTMTGVGNGSVVSDEGAFKGLAVSNVTKMLQQETGSGKYTLYLFGTKTVLNESNDNGFEGNVSTGTYVVAIKLPGGSGKTVAFGNYVKESSNALDADETIFVVMDGKAATGDASQQEPNYNAGITMTIEGTAYTLNVVGMTALPE